MMIPAETMEMQVNETRDRLAAKDARIAELEMMIRRMVDQGDRCNWFCDRLDEELRAEALELIGD